MKWLIWIKHIVWLTLPPYINNKTGVSRKKDEAVKIMIKTKIIFWKTIEGNGTLRARVRVRIKFLLFCSELVPLTRDVTSSLTLLGRIISDEAMSDEGLEFSSYEMELRNQLTQSDVTLRVNNSKIFIEFLLSSYYLDFVKYWIKLRVTNSKVKLLLFYFRVADSKLKNKKFHFELLTRRLNIHFFNYKLRM